MYLWLLYGRPSDPQRFQGSMLTVSGLSWGSMCTRAPIPTPLGPGHHLTERSMTLPIMRSMNGMTAASGLLKFAAVDSHVHDSTLLLTRGPYLLGTNPRFPPLL